MHNSSTSENTRLSFIVTILLSSFSFVVYLFVSLYVLGISGQKFTTIIVALILFLVRIACLANSYLLWLNTSIILEYKKTNISFQMIGLLLTSLVLVIIIGCMFAFLVGIEGDYLVFIMLLPYIIDSLLAIICNLATLATLNELYDPNKYTKVPYRSYITPMRKVDPIYTGKNKPKVFLCYDLIKSQ